MLQNISKYNVMNLDDTKVTITVGRLRQLIEETKDGDLGQLEELVQQGAGFTRISELTKDDSLESFCKKLQFLLKAKDPKTLALYARFRKSWKNYYRRIKVIDEYVPIKNLHPTQNIIYAKKSLEPILSGKWNFNGKDAIDVLMDSRNPKINLDDPLVVCEINGIDYIVDGHHRWSKAYAFNPYALMQANRIVNGPFDNVDDVLKFAQGTITMLQNKNPVNMNQPSDDVNMYDLDEIDLGIIIEESISELTKKKIFGDPKFQRVKLATKYHLDDMDSLCSYMMKNIETMRVSAPAGEHDREFMPQYPSDIAPDDAVLQIAAESKITLTIGQILRLIEEARYF